MKKPMWEPSADLIKNANMTRFIDFVNKRYGLKVNSYNELHEWSVNYLSDFWAAMWDFGEIKASKPYDTIMVTGKHMIDTKWFPGARLNFAENMLRYRDNQTALIFKNEGAESVKMTYAELYDHVARLAKALRDSGVKMGDRVAGFMPNRMETVCAMLATTSIGAIWSSCSSDFGLKGALDRFGQIKPKVLFTTNGYFYNGRAFDSLKRVAEIMKDLPSIEKVVVVAYTESNPDVSHVPNAVRYDDFISKEKGLEIQFEQVPADHPLYIMYSSGTTGLPKCMVQSTAGILIAHIKELKLHTNVKREDTIFYFTTCGWMMWNWLVSSLALGATVVLFDGSPFYPDPGVLFEMTQNEGITIFGTSPRYLAEIEKVGLKPAQKYNLASLKTVISTGAPLSVGNYEYVYRDIKQDVLLSSVSGGTDINGCFFIGNPLLPVYAGELQCQGLAFDMQAFDSQGKPVLNQQGELVCTKPYPSMPLYFRNDEGNKRYLDAYFDVYPNVWHHGDFVEMTETGGAIIYGRSDATLNPSGVRIGTAEIYRVLENVSEIRDSLVIGQEWENDERVILFVRLADGVQLNEDLVKKIRNTIKENLSPRHLPARIIPVGDIPYTINMKKVEIAVRNIVHNKPVLNVDALANPESLEYYKNIKELQS